METLTSEMSGMSDPTNCADIGRCICSRESAAGRSHCDSPESLTITPSSRALAPANLSARQAKELGLLTSGTYGQSCTTSSNSSSLGSSWGNKLQARLGSSGSILYRLIWKDRVTPGGLRISALRASVLRTSDRDCSGAAKGWTTPQAHDTHPRGAGNRSNPKAGNACLAWDAQMAGWPTATVNDSRNGANATAKRNNPDSKHHSGTTLVDAAVMAGWPTAAARDHKGVNAAGSELTYNARPLNEVAMLAGWGTPNASAPGGTPERALERKAGLPCRQSVTTLDHQAQLIGPARITADGRLLTGSSAEMASGGRLNPAFSLWLMGYPSPWMDSAPSREQVRSKGPETLSCRK